jgi:predicted transcriptional regulator
MARPASSQPTEVELQILKILWESGPCSARDVHNALAEDKVTNYSTTVKMLSVMLDKGLVCRDESVHPMAFSAAVSREKTRQSVLVDVIQKLYDGSAMSLVMQVLSSQQATPADLDEIRKLISNLESQQSVPTKTRRR